MTMQKSDNVDKFYKSGTVETLPLIPMREMVIFPHSLVHFDVGRAKTIKAVETAMEDNQRIFVTMQINHEIETPSLDDVCTFGVIAKIKQIVRLPGDGARVLVEGLERAILLEFDDNEFYIKADVSSLMIEEMEHADFSNNDHDVVALLRYAKSTYEKYYALNPRVSTSALPQILSQDDVGVLADLICANCDMGVKKKQEMLEIISPLKRLEESVFVLSNEIEILGLERKITSKVKARIDKNQREFYLREQVKSIRDELGEGDNADEYLEYIEKIQLLKLNKDSEEKLIKEAKRLSKISPSSPDSGLIKNYLDTILDLPWRKSTKENYNIEKATQILNRDHYGLENVKERILEFLAVRKLTKGMSSPILCLVGPPGVGKTSIAKSIAETTGRKYGRISLGGIRDEAEIRGHRKTYIGAMPGRIINAVKISKSKNPLILLDEIDKLSNDYKGDPSSALLEVLDSAQNNTFTDNFVEIPFDLSDVLFITTANSLDTISRPLLDRMEVIEISGYTTIEKENIAKGYLVPKQLKNHGLTSSGLDVSFKDSAITTIINEHTREAGVRNLEREIGAVCRKVAKNVVEENVKKIVIDSKSVGKYLGKAKASYEKVFSAPQVGVARGLAWTSVGGDTLSIEVTVTEGTGKIELTGKLGDVMKESARIAITYIRSMAEDGKYNIDKEFYKNSDIHIHVPEGAVPKDGPSAGITMTTALVSALSKIPVKNTVAMTGEVTLRGRVLPIGGLKEKSMAAYRADVKTIIFPKDNEKNLEDIAQEIKKHIKFIPVSQVEEVLDIALDK